MYISTKEFQDRKFNVFNFFSLKRESFEPPAYRSHDYFSTKMVFKMIIISLR